jgi:serine/threonine protein phosphatase 1
MKTFVIGDIHGCFTELEDLLDKAGVAGDDRIIALGDIVDRGPDSVQVLDFFSNHPSRLSLMGNHERKHIRGARHEVRLALSQIISREEFGTGYPQALEWMGRFPLFLDLPEAVLVHGYLEPGVSLEQQRDTVLCGTMSGDHYLRSQYEQPWYVLYDGEKPVIVGHHDHLRNGQPFVFRDRVFCLDTSCAHGGTLTGLLLPDFKLMSVPSQRDYWREIRQKFAMTKSPQQVTPPKRTLPGGWDDASEQILERIAGLAQAESRRILTELQDVPGFSELTSRQQAKVYAATVGSEMPWAALLHQARNGEIRLDTARRLFKSQAEVRDLLSRLNGGDEKE